MYTIDGFIKRLEDLRETLGRGDVPVVTLSHVHDETIYYEVAAAEIVNVIPGTQRGEHWRSERGNVNTDRVVSVF